ALSEEVKRLQSQLANAKDFTVGLSDELLSGDEFNPALAHVASLGIAFGAKNGLRIWRTEVEFEAAAWNDSKFSIRAEAEFNKALDAFPSIQFPFLGKVASAAESPLSGVIQIVLEKFVHLVRSVSNVVMVVSGVLLGLKDFLVLLKLLLLVMVSTAVIKNGNKVLKKIVGTIEQIYEPTSVEEKLDITNEMKDRGTLLMALPNKDQLKFHSYQDAKLLIKAIEKRHGGKNESKKVQRTLLKQQYENFAASSSETLDQTFNRLQKLISKLEIQGGVIEQEDISLKLLRSLPSEWKTYALIGKNKAKIETISLDDFTNNTNEADNTAYGVSTARTQGLIVECFKCHKNRHFTRECRASKNQENRGREYGRKTVPVENLIENALIAQDGIGGLGYKVASPVVENFVNLSKIIENKENVKSISYKGYHAVPPPYTGNYIPPKPDLMFMDEHVESEYVNVVSNVTSSAVKTIESVDVKNKDVYNTIETIPVKKNNFNPPIIEDWISDDESEFRFRIDFEISHKVSTLILLDLSKGINPYTWLRQRKNLVMRGSDEGCSTFESEDEEYAVAVRDFKKFFKRR
nr:hypothetical protein [Tanacetum cinerariifolium]